MVLIILPLCWQKEYGPLSAIAEAKAEALGDLGVVGFIYSHPKQRKIIFNRINWIKFL